jgi:hypothetical protein
MVIQWGHKVCSQQDVVVSEKGLIHPGLSHKSLSFMCVYIYIEFKLFSCEHGDQHVPISMDM